MHGTSKNDLIKLAIAKKRLAEIEEAKVYEGSLLEFTKYVWPVIEPAIPFQHGWVTEAICEHLEAVSRGYIRRLLINVPPGFTKSILTDVMFPAWEWGPRNMPHLRYVCASYSNHLTERDNMRCRNIVVNDRYRRLWGNRFTISNEQFTKIKFANDKTGWKLATSVGGIGVGERGDRFICFPRDEVVHTRFGLRQIGDLVDAKERVEVLSFNTKTGESVYCPIVGWHQNPPSKMLRINLSDGSHIRCTPNHRLWSQSRWVTAAELVPNTPLSVCGKPLSFSKFPPCSATTNGLNGSSADAIAGRQGIGAICRILCDFLRLPPIQFSQRSPLMKRKSAMFFGVSNILSASTIFQIVDSIVRRLTVFVANFVPETWWVAQKGAGNQNMHFKMHGLALSPQIDAGITAAVFEPFADGRPKNAPFGPMCALGFDDQTREGPDSAMARGGIVGEPRDGQPNLFVVGVESDGHVEETFCLTVEETHTFCVGRTAPIIVANCDDPNNTMEMESEQIRYTTNMWFTEVVPDRLNSQKDSAIVVIQQRLHEDDVSGTAIAREMGYTHLCIPMYYEPVRHINGWDGERITTYIGENIEKVSENEVFWEDPRTEQGDLAWPERFPLEICEELRRDKGPYAWAGQYMMSPEPRGGAILKREYWKLWDGDKYPPFEYLLASIDTAYTEKQENDPSALTIWGIFRDEARNPKIMLVYAWQDRLEFHALCQRIIDLCTIDGRKLNHPRFPVDRIIIEPKASGQSVAQELHRLVGYSGKVAIELVNYSKGKYTPDKVARAHSIQHLFADGMIYAPDRTFADMVINQCAVFPKGSHDDLVDTTSMALRYLRDAGFALMREEYAMEVHDELILRPRQGALYPV